VNSGGRQAFAGKNVQKIRGIDYLAAACG
jgi:hypothetical protein